jgi:N-(2-amino-2-carboxyethyl)-L-glutamate synthase
VVTISEERTIETCLSFVRDHHLLVGGSTGTVLAAVQELAPEFAPGDTIVAISPDLGDKYMDTVYDPAWVENHSDSKAEERYAPIPLRLK